MGWGQRPKRVTRSCDLRGAALEREDALGTTLDEQDDEAQDDDLAEHGASRRLEHLVDEAEAEAAASVPASFPTPPSTTTMKESTMYALTELGAYVAELRQRDAAEPATPEPMPNVSMSTLARGDPHSGRHLTVLGDGAGR